MAFLSLHCHLIPSKFSIRRITMTWLMSISLSLNWTTYKIVPLKPLNLYFFVPCESPIFISFVAISGYCRFKLLIVSSLRDGLRSLSLSLSLSPLLKVENFSVVWAIGCPLPYHVVTILFDGLVVDLYKLVPLTSLLD